MEMYGRFWDKMYACWQACMDHGPDLLAIDMKQLAVIQ